MTACGELIPASLIRQVWDEIEQTQSRMLLQLNDQDLIQQLLSQLQHQRSLNLQELQTVKIYLSNRTSLIRDIAGNRCGVSYC